MAEQETGGWRGFFEGLTPNRAPELPQDDFARASLERHKREGMLLAVRARWVSLAVIAIMLPSCTLLIWIGSPRAAISFS